MMIRTHFNLTRPLLAPPTLQKLDPFLGRVTFDIKPQRESRRGHLTYASVEGPRSPPLTAHTLPSFWREEILAKYPSRPALIACHEKPGAHGGGLSRNLAGKACLAWDFEEFSRHVDAFARGLMQMGVKKGERVAVIMGNDSAYAILQWACASVGAILVPINPAYQFHELVHTLGLTEAQHLCIVPNIRSSHYIRMLATSFPEIRSMDPQSLTIERLPMLRTLVLIDNTDEGKPEMRRLNMRCFMDWRDIPVWCEGAEHALAQKQIEANIKKDDVVTLQFTSGTTGYPKAASLDHESILNNSISCGDRMNLGQRDVLCNLAAWSHGACVVYPSSTWNASSIVNALTQEQCSAVHGVPTHFIEILAEVERRRKSGQILDFKNLRTGATGGSLVPIPLMRKLASDLNLTELTVIYGMTETGPLSFQTRSSDPRRLTVETVGEIMPHVKAKVVDPHGKTVPINTPGTLLVSGYLLQQGYWRDKSSTDAVMKRDEEGTLWMDTGDLASMDRDGYLSIVGRAKVQSLSHATRVIVAWALNHVLAPFKDQIIRGGENLSPALIESVLGTHNSIHEVAVVAVPDAKFGEVVGAWIIRKAGENALNRQDIRDVVRKAISPKNTPSWVWFIGEDGVPADLPRTASGKVKKSVLREWSRDLVKSGIGEV